MTGAAEVDQRVALIGHVGRAVAVVDLRVDAGLPQGLGEGEGVHPDGVPAGQRGDDLVDSHGGECTGRPRGLRGVGGGPRHAPASPGAPGSIAPSFTPPHQPHGPGPSRHPGPGGERALVRALVALGALAVTAAGGALAAPAVAGAYPTSTVVITGHGWGHGIGMGQWGALGYAIGADNGDGNWTWQQIVTHYYGGTTIETAGNDAQTRRSP